MNRKVLAAIAAVVLVIAAVLIVIAVTGEPAKGTITDKMYTPEDREWEKNKTTGKWGWDTDPEECRLVLTSDGVNHQTVLVPCSRYHQVKVGDYWNGK